MIFCRSAFLLPYVLLTTILYTERINAEKYEFFVIWGILKTAEKAYINQLSTGQFFQTLTGKSTPLKTQLITQIIFLQNQFPHPSFSLPFSPHPPNRPLPNHFQSYFHLHFHTQILSTNKFKPKLHKFSLYKKTLILNN